MPLRAAFSCALLGMALSAQTGELTMATEKSARIERLNFIGLKQQ